MNNRLLLVMLPPELIVQLMDEVDDPASPPLQLDLGSLALRSRSLQASFELMPRHRRMFIEGLDSIGLSLRYQDQIEAFAKKHWQTQPWLKNVAALTRQRLSTSE